MVRNIIVTVDAESRQVRTNTNILGVVGENLQGYFIVDFKGNGFVDGSCFLELQIGKEKGYVALSRENNTYKAPIKSGITQTAGLIEAQVRITQTEVEDDTPIFKSDTFELRVLESINAVDEIADEYPDWIDQANAKLAELEQAIAEVKGVTGSKQYIKNFVKGDFLQAGTKQRWYLQITKSEHGLTNPYVDKVVIHKKVDSEETQGFHTEVICQDKVLTTGTIKIYITIDLSQYTEYSGVIYLKGE